MYHVDKNVIHSASHVLHNIFSSEDKSYVNIIFRSWFVFFNMWTPSADTNTLMTNSGGGGAAETPN